MSTLAALVTSLVVVAAQAEAPSTATQPAAPPANAAQPTDGDAIPSDVSALLDRIERTGKAMKSVQGDVTWAKFDRANEETLYRLGRLVIDGAGTGRRVAARFDTLIVSTALSDETSDIDERYVYENCWLWEIKSVFKSLKKRQVAEEGAAYDPFELGAGNLPLPMGQTKAAVLKEFDVSLCEIPKLPAFEGMENVKGLKLVPKPTSALRDEYSELNVFYSVDANDFAVLEGVHASQKASTTTIRLRSPKLNAALSAEDRESLKTPDLGDSSWQTGWTIDVQRLAPAVTAVEEPAAKAPEPAKK